LQKWYVAHCRKRGLCCVTKILEKAFDAVSKLPEKDQDAMAAFVLDELESEERWAKAFSSSQDALVSLANEALAEYKSGKTKTLDNDRDLSHD
jgi:hypothetical protein